MVIEREFKFIAGAGFEMPDLTDADPRLVVGVPRRVQLDSTYYDTAALSLARSGVTLRARTGEEAPIWTLKLGGSKKTGPLERAEHTFDEPVGPIPRDARLAVRAHVRSQTLGPVLHLRSDRTEVPISFGDQPFLTVSDDRVVADVGSEPGTTFREVELELTGSESNSATVDRIIDAINAAGARPDDPLPKALRALGTRALGPPDVEIGSVGRKATLRDLVRHVIAKSVAQLQDHHPGVWLGDDPECVHRFRVATRRLRSDLRTFDPLLDRHWTSWLRGELKWLGAEIGVGRDADVLAARLQSQMMALPPQDRPGVERLRQRLAENSDEARCHVLAALSSDRYAALLDALVDAARDPRMATDPPGNAESYARETSVKLVRKPWRNLKKLADALSDDAADLAFHAVRIRAKRVRYAAEAVEPVVGRKARKFADAIAEVQTVLGEHQDTAVAEHWLRHVAVEMRGTQLVIGELLTLERLERLRLRNEFAAVWRKAGKQSLRDWFD